jgi:tetratricopeptide (TPR) repeat protein
VRAVLTGTVAKQGDSLHIDTALVDARDGSELWGAGYDRKASDMGNVQQEIARDMSSKLRLRLSSQIESVQEKIPPQDSEAYLLYLRGRYYLDKQTTNDVRTSIDYFQQALSRSPNFARAYAGLADAYISLGQPWIGGLSPRQALQEGKTAAENAIRLANVLSEAHVSLAHVLVLHDWDWRRAEEEYQCAIELDPNSAQAHNWYSELLQVQGRTDESVREVQKAAQLDPVNLQYAAVILTTLLANTIRQRQYSVLLTAKLHCLGVRLLFTVPVVASRALRDRWRSCCVADSRDDQHSRTISNRARLPRRICVGRKCGICQ